VAVIARLLLVLHLLFPQRLETLPGTVAPVCQPLLHELLDGGIIVREAFGLVEGPLVVIEIEPLHALEDGIDGLLGGTFEVCVLDAQHELATMLFCIEPGKERGTRSANMQEARRARGKSGTDCHGDPWKILKRLF